MQFEKTIGSQSVDRGPFNPLRPLRRLRSPALRIIASARAVDASQPLPTSTAIVCASGVRAAGEEK
jgi:hypothetical protein